MIVVNLDDAYREERAKGPRFAFDTSLSVPHTNVYCYFGQDNIPLHKPLRSSDVVKTLFSRTAAGFLLPPSDKIQSHLARPLHAPNFEAVFALDPVLVRSSQLSVLLQYAPPDCHSAISALTGSQILGAIIPRSQLPACHPPPPPLPPAPAQLAAHLALAFARHLSPAVPSRTTERPYGLDPRADRSG